MEEMEELESRRWNPGFVVMRWRHLFWLMPLLGLVTGLAWTWMEDFEEISVSGLVEYRADVTDNSSNEKLALDGIALLTSDRVLERASTQLSLDKPWWVDASVASLRSRQTVEFDPVRGSPVIRMTVTGRGKKATGDVWEAIYKAAESISWQISAEAERARELVELDAANKEVLRLEREMVALGQSPMKPGALEAVLRELSAARGEQDHAQMNLECGMKLSLGGMDLISPPDTPPVLPARFGPVGMLGFHGAMGFGVGVILAMCLAYGLEVVRPRRSEVEV
jgi:hypothetical protein